MDQELVSLITINFNSLDVTVEMLESVRKLSYPNLEVIVVDNASKENPGAFLKKNFPEVKFIRSEENLGFSGGNNLGIKAAKGSYFYFINNDTELVEGSIEYLLDCFKTIDRLGAVSPLIYHHPEVHQQKGELIQYAGTTAVNPVTARNRTIGAGEIDEGQFNQAVPTSYVHGAAMMIPRKVVEKVGMMPEEFFLYYEELDWSAHIRKAGYEIYIEPRAKIYHKESVSVGKMSTLKTFYLNRNRILFTRRHRSKVQVFLFSLFLIFITIPKNILVYLVKGEWAHVRAFWRAVTWHLGPESKLAFRNLPRLKASTSQSKV